MRTAKRTRTGKRPTLRNGDVSICLTNDRWVGYLRGKRVTDFYWAGREAQLIAAIDWLEEAAMVA